MGKIGITCRQPFLGALDWVEREIKQAHDAPCNIKTTKIQTNPISPFSNIISSNTKKDKK